VKQAKSSELVKEHHKILTGDGDDGKINRIHDKKRRPAKDKGKGPEKSKDQKNSTRPPVKKCYRCGKIATQKRGMSSYQRHLPEM